MAKRFIGTDIWGQDWFLDMPNEYKLFWNYILCECDHAGLYKVNAKTFGRMIETKIDTDKAIEYFNQDKVRIRIVNRTTWFIEDFINFQYGSQLNPANRLHNSVLKLLGELDLNLTSIRGLKDLNVGLKDKDKDKDIIDSKNNPLHASAREDGFVPPTQEEVVEYFLENYYSENSAISAWEYYNSHNWHDKDDTPVKNWKLKCRTNWFKEKDRIEKPSDEELQKKSHSDKIKKLYFKNGKYSYQGVESIDFDDFRYNLYLKNVDLYNNLK